MRTAFRTLALMVLVAASAAIPHAAQPSDAARLTGRVTDDSGAALPGVIVSAISTGLNGPLTTLTDGAGRYTFQALAPDRYDLRFELSGFEPRTRVVVLAAAEAATVDQQLGLAPLAETVTVVATAPPPPPPPPPVRARPTIVIPDGALASVCGPSQPRHADIVGHVLRHRDDPHRSLYGRGDALVLDVGRDQGIEVGQNLVVRRRFQVGDRTVPREQAVFGEHTAGLVQVAEAAESSAIAVVVYACDEIELGDGLEPFDALPKVAEETGGSPQFDDPARVIFGDDGRVTGAPPQLMVIDRGAQGGVTRGQRLTIFRPAHGAPGRVLPIAEAVVVGVQPNGATIRLERAIDAVTVGDLAALHR